jgi:hypothetical protein
MYIPRYINSSLKPALRQYLYTYILFYIPRLQFTYVHLDTYSKDPELYTRPRGFVSFPKSTARLCILKLTFEADNFFVVWPKRCDACADPIQWCDNNVVQSKAGLPDVIFSNQKSQLG